MKQYLKLCQRIVDEGQWVENKRTGTRCLTVINADLEYDVANNQFPMITTRKSYYKAAIAELLGYYEATIAQRNFVKLAVKHGMLMPTITKLGLITQIVKVKMIWAAFTASKGAAGNALMAQHSIS